MDTGVNSEHVRPSRVVVTLLAGCASGLLVVSCGGTSVSPSFPSAERLERYEAVPAPEMANLAHIPPDWVLDTVPPRMSASSNLIDDPAMRDAAPYVESIAAGAVPDANLQCAADAIARARARGEDQSPRLLRWIQTRCGVNWGESRTNYFTSSSPTTPAQLEGRFSQIRPPARDRRSDASMPLRWAVADAGHNGNHVYVVTFMQPRMHLDPVPMVPDMEGNVVVSGRVPARVESIMGGITQGRFGAEDCLLDDEVELPAFRLVCPVEPQDDRAWISVYTRDRGRLLSEEVGSFFVSPDGSLPTDFRLDREAVSALVAGETIDEQSTLAAINEIRQRINLPPLRLDDAQSDAVARVAGAFWTAWTEDDLETVDVLGLGIMAGWEIEEPIVDGAFASTADAIPSDLATYIALELLRPGFRQAALGPDVDIAALSFLRTGGNLLSLSAYYVSLVDADHVAATQEVNQLLDARRAAAGHGPATRMPNNVQRTVLQHAENIHVRDRNPTAQLTQMLQNLGPRYNRLQGWMLTSQSISEVRFPAAFIQGSGYEVAMAAAAWQGRNDAWSAWITLIAVDNLPRRVDLQHLNEAFLAEGWTPVYITHDREDASQEMSTVAHEAAGTTGVPNGQLAAPTTRLFNDVFGSSP